ncbi:MAG: 3-hydroxyacyl-CoA dehydrogenase family protein, partial [Chitinophagaceae bacterium]
MERKVNTTQITIGVVGLGLMGSSIVVSLLLAGHPVVALAPVKGEEKDAALRIRALLEHCARNGLTNKSVENYLSSLTISTDYRDLEDCRLVLECVLEEIDIKKAVYK